MRIFSERIKKTHTVTGSILLACDESLGVEETSVGARLDLVDDIGFKVDVQRTGDMFARRSLGEEGTETIVVLRRGAFSDTAIGLNKSSEYDDTEKTRWTLTLRPCSTV
jgi:hypothetical protein